METITSIYTKYKEQERGKHGEVEREMIGGEGKEEMCDDGVC